MATVLIQNLIRNFFLTDGYSGRRFQKGNKHS